eukprot:1195248-Prorocentrum_minimum.AAC.3
MKTYEAVQENGSNINEAAPTIYTLAKWAPGGRAGPQRRLQGSGRRLRQIRGKLVRCDRGAEAHLAVELPDKGGEAGGLIEDEGGGGAPCRRTS